jgi:hypothetical protein
MPTVSFTTFREPSQFRFQDHVSALGRLLVLKAGDAERPFIVSGDVIIWLDSADFIDFTSFLERYPIGTFELLNSGESITLKQA